MYNFNDKSFNKQTQFDHDIYEYKLVNGRKVCLQREVKFYPINMEDLSIHIEVTQRLKICPVVNLGIFCTSFYEVELCFCVWLSALQTISKTKDSIYDVKRKLPGFEIK